MLQCASAADGRLQFAACSCDWVRTPWGKANLPLLAHVFDVASPEASHCEEPEDDDDDDEFEMVESDEASAVAAFLRQHVPRWDMSSSLLDVGLDSLDQITIRNSFNKTFALAAPVALFTAPSQTLGGLLGKLEDLVAA